MVRFKLWKHSEHQVGQKDDENWTQKQQENAKKALLGLLSTVKQGSFTFTR